MLRLLAIAVVLAGCGPYGSSQVGRTCTEAQSKAREQACASPTTYAACDTGVWREYPCQDACVEGKTCDLGAAKHGDPCPAAWEGARACKSTRVSVACVDGAWVQHGCTACPMGQVCYDFACECA